MSHGDAAGEDVGLDALAEKVSLRIIFHSVGVPLVVETITNRPTEDDH
jgi:hypothetical protein